MTPLTTEAVLARCHYVESQRLRRRCHLLTAMAYVHDVRIAIARGKPGDAWFYACLVRDYREMARELGADIRAAALDAGRVAA